MQPWQRQLYASGPAPRPASAASSRRRTPCTVVAFGRTTPRDESERRHSLPESGVRRLWPVTVKTREGTVWVGSRASEAVEEGPLPTAGVLPMGHQGWTRHVRKSRAAKRRWRLLRMWARFLAGIGGFRGVKGRGAPVALGVSDVLSLGRREKRAQDKREPASVATAAAERSKRRERAQEKEGLLREIEAEKMRAREGERRRESEQRDQAAEIERLRAELAQEKEKVREMTAAAAEEKPQKQSRGKKARSPSTAARRKKK